AALAPVPRGRRAGAGPAPPELRLLLFARTRGRHAAQPGPRGSRGGPAGRFGRGPLRVLRPGLPVRRGRDRGAVPPWADGAGANRAAVGGGAGGWRPQGSDPGGSDPKGSPKGNPKGSPKGRPQRPPGPG